MGGADLVVPHRADHQGPGDPDPAEQEAQEVDRALIGPVEVVDDEHATGGAGGARTPPRRSRGAGSPASTAVTSSPSWSARSWMGPSGRGVVSGSHAPQSTGTSSPTASTNACRSVLFPAPDSPLTTVRPPRPSRARWSRPTRNARSSSRSCNLTAGSVPTSGNPSPERAAWCDMTSSFVASAAPACRGARHPSWGTATHLGPGTPLRQRADSPEDGQCSPMPSCARWPIVGSARRHLRRRHDHPSRRTTK